MRMNETHNKARVRKLVSSAFPFQGGQKQWHTLLPLPFSFTLEYVIRMAWDIRDGSSLSGTHQLLVCVDEANSLIKNIERHEEK
jgi:hypothetical protein